MSLKPQYRQNVFLCFPCNACTVCTVKSLIYWCFDLEISEPQACADEYGVMDPNKFEAKANLGCRGAAPHCIFLKHLVCWFTAKKRKHSCQWRSASVNLTTLWNYSPRRLISTQALPRTSKKRTHLWQRCHLEKSRFNLFKRICVSNPPACRRGLLIFLRCILW